MNLLLDTNVISEFAKEQPDERVVRWLAELDEDRIFLSVLTLGELREGVDRLAPGRRRERLDAWLRNDLVDRFEGRILDVDIEVVDRWGRLRAEHGPSGRTLPVIDSLLAATALRYSLVMVTRNIADFRDVVPDLEDPWLTR